MDGNRKFLVIQGLPLSKRQKKDNNKPFGAESLDTFQEEGRGPTAGKQKSKLKFNMNSQK